MLASVFALSVNAQVSVTLSDAPVIGDVLYYEDLSGPFTSLPGGPSQLWDLSCPGMGQIVAPDSLQLVDPAQTPGWSFFLDATVAGINSSSPDAVVNYFRASDHGLEDIGEYHGSGSAYIAPDPQLLIPYPCTFGDTWLDTTLWCLDTTICLIHYDACSADGFGTVMMPAGVIENVLRTRCVEERTTEVGGEIQIETFTNDRYWKAGFPMHLAWVNSYRYQIGEADPEESFTVQRLVDLASLVGSGPVAPDALNCRFDPASGELTYVCSDPSAARAEVLDGQGRVIAAATFAGNRVPTRQMIMSLGTLACGTYLLHVVAEENAHFVRFAVLY